MSTALQEIFARFGVEFDPGREIERGQSRIDGLAANLQTAGAAITGSIAFLRVRDFVRETVELGSAVDDTSQILGISRQELQEWQHVARLSGAEVGEFTSAFVRLQDRMAAGGEGAAVFRRLGVEIRNADGSLRSASDVLGDLADPIASIGSDAERTGVLIDLLGRSGARLGPLFAQGSEGVAAARAELAALGGGLSDEAVQASADLGDAWDRLDTVALSLRGRLAVLVLPALERTTNATIALSRNTHLLDAVIVSLGIALVQLAAGSSAVWGPMVAGAARALLPIAALVLVVDDLMTLFRGGDSLIGRTMDALGGDGTQIEFVTAMNEGWGRLVDRLREARDFWVDLVGGETSIGDQTAGGVQRTATRGFDPNAGGGVTLEGEIRRDVIREVDALAPEWQIQSQTRERLAALAAPRAAPSAPSAPPAVTQTVRIDRIDASGLDEAAATRVATRAVRDALAAENADTLDTLARGAVE